MDHDNIVRAHIPERYFLGELPSDERDEFEEHLADCSACRKDLAVTDVFAANAVAVFEEDARVEAAAPAHKAGWMDFLRPKAFPMLALSGVLNFALLLFVGYGVTRMSRETQPGVSDIFTVRPPARSAGDQVFTISQSRRFAVLQFDLAHTYQRYSYSVDDPRAKTDISAPARADTLVLTVPVAGLKPGDHQLRVTGWNGQQELEIGHCLLRVEQEK